ncbi:MAG: hypothetical protein WCS89_01985 [Candidatus Paceibacterota bacterium]
MSPSFSIKSLSHHAYCLIGGDSVRDQLVVILNEEHSIPIHGNSDLFQKRYENFTIDDARELKLAHEMRPIQNEGKKIFIITADNINVEAQNALLKLLEEPAEYAHFFLIIPGSHLLLPTVKSRLSFVEMIQGKGGKSGGNSGNDSEVTADAKKFVSLNPAKRLEMVKNLLDEITKEKKTKQHAINFLNAIQEEVYKKKGVAGNLESLIATETARKYVSDRSPSLKMLLEYVALNI